MRFGPALNEGCIFCPDANLYYFYQQQTKYLQSEVRSAAVFGLYVCGAACMTIALSDWFVAQVQRATRIAGKQISAVQSNE